MQMAKFGYFTQLNQIFLHFYLQTDFKGVLASFVLLLSTVVSEQRHLNETSDDIINTFSIQEEPNSILIMNLPFAQRLTNPCSWGGSYSGPSRLFLNGGRAKFIKDFFTLVSHYSKIYKEDVQEILGNHTITGCANLHVGNLPDTPTLAELQEMTMEEALNKIYLSLLVHSAYSFVIHYQVNSTNVRCSDDIQEEQSLAIQSYNMALKLKSLACYVLVGMTVLGYEKDDVTSLLSVQVSDLTLCSRRAIRDCQVMSSAKRFLQGLQSYAAEDLEKTSTSSVPTSSTTSSSTVLTSSTAFTSSFVSTLSTAITSSTTDRPTTTHTSSIISTLLTTSSSFESTTSTERTID